MPLPHVDALLATIHTLRSPGGCPWDRKQTLIDAARYLLDEAGELLEAALAGDAPHAAEELADLLYMVCFCCEILGEAGPYHFDEVARLGDEKLIRRHPHVFGDRPANDHRESQQRWNEVKAAERRARGENGARESILKELPAASSPLHQAYSYQDDAAGVGFDWPSVDGVWDKLAEETAELRAAAARGEQAAISHEAGDLLFAAVNLIRHLGAQPDDVLRLANRRFSDRFHQVEARFGWSRPRLRATTLDDLEAAWQEAKRAGSGAGPAHPPPSESPPRGEPPVPGSSGQPSSSSTPS
jgi:MazG family protein